MLGSLRGISGYMDDGAILDFVANKAYTLYPAVESTEAGLVAIIIAKTSVYTNAKNNTPVSLGINGGLTLQFVEATGDEPMPGPEIFEDF